MLHTPCLPHCNLQQQGWSHRTPKAPSPTPSPLLSPTVPRPLPLPSLKAFVTDLGQWQVDFCHGLIDTKGVGEGLQSGTRPSGQQTHGRFTAAVLHRACLAQTCTRDMPRLSICAQDDSWLLSDPYVAIQSTLVYTFARWFASTLFQQFIPRSLTATFLMSRHSAMSFPIRMEDKVPEG